MGDSMSGWSIRSAFRIQAKGLAMFTIAVRLSRRLIVLVVLAILAVPLSIGLAFGVPDFWGAMNSVFYDWFVSLGMMEPYGIPWSWMLVHFFMFALPPLLILSAIRLSAYPVRQRIRLRGVSMVPEMARRCDQSNRRIYRSFAGERPT